jgi:hypothetical protein
LHSSETSNLHLFLFLDALLLCGFTSFSGSFALVVVYDFLFLVDFFLAGLLLFGKSNLIGSLDFSDHFQIANALYFSSLYLGKSHGLNLASHLFLLLCE